MLSVNQMNAQVKITEMWKAKNINNYPLIIEFQSTLEGNRATRASARGDLVIECKSDLSKAAFINDAAKIWNNSPMHIKECKSLYSAKIELKKYVLSLPL